MSKGALPQKKKKEVKGTPIAPWMVTFADMMTLLLVFFVLILSFSTMEVERFRAVSMALQNSFGFQMMNPLNLIPVDKIGRASCRERLNISTSAVTLQEIYLNW